MDKWMEATMDRAEFLRFTLLLAGGALAGIAFPRGRAVAAAMAMTKTSEATVTFHVAWYDVGKAALEGLPGVKRVERGFRGFKEIDTVVYDPAAITVERMVDVLQRAGTYRGTLKW